MKKGLGLLVFLLVFCHFAVAQGTIFSWDFSDCEIKDILFAVSMDTGISIVPDDTVSGKGDLYDEENNTVGGVTLTQRSDTKYTLDSAKLYIVKIKGNSDGMDVRSPQ